MVRARLSAYMPLILAGACIASAASAAAPVGIRWDKTSYSVHDCASATIMAPGFSTQSLESVHLTIAAVDGPAARAKRVDVPLTHDAGSAWLRTRRCIPLESRVAVKPGQSLVAIAYDGAKKPIGVSFAHVRGGPGNAAFHAVVDSALSSVVPPAEQYNGDTAVDVIVGPNGQHGSFARDQLILRETNPGDLESFLIRHPARVLNTLALRGSANEGPARFHLLRVAPTKPDAKELGRLEKMLAHRNGTWKFSSAEGLALVALQAEELAAGTAVTLNMYLQPLSVPRTSEATSVGDQFAQVWFNPRDTDKGSRLRIGEGLALAQILRHGASTVPVAFIDAGFAGPTDFTPPLSLLDPDYGMAFGSIPQCSVSLFGHVSCGAGKAAGASSIVETRNSCNIPCRWHGTYVFGLAAARLNNGSGVGGVGSSFVDPRFLRLEKAGVFATAAALNEAVNPTVGVPAARIVNMSFGSSCDAFVFDLCNRADQAVLLGALCTLAQIAASVPIPIGPAALACGEIAALVALAADFDSLHAAVESAYRANVIMVTGAGNDGKDVGDQDFVPCVYDHVICVGGIDSKGKPIPIVAAPDSNFGDAVAAWTPYYSVGTPVPDQTGALSPAALFAGTSGSTPYVTGALAIAVGINPTLDPNRTRKLLDQSLCRSSQTARLDGSLCTPSTDTKVDHAGYLDLLNLAYLARLDAKKPTLAPCTGGWDIAEGTPLSIASNDDLKHATEIAPLSIGLMTRERLPEKGSGDFSIHAISAAKTPEEDWYRIRFEQRGLTKPLGRVITVSLGIPDLSFGTPVIDLMQVCRSSGKLTLVPGARTSVDGGRFKVQARVRTDTDYFARVHVSTADESNCYSDVEVKVEDTVNLPTCE